MSRDYSIGDKGKRERELGLSYQRQVLEDMGMGHGIRQRGTEKRDKETNYNG